MLVRLDGESLHKMKWHAREVFSPARHSHTLEALARGLGLSTYTGLLAHAESYGGILWDGDDSRAVAFLAEREITVRPGGIAEIVAEHVVDHERFC